MPYRDWPSIADLFFGNSVAKPTEATIPTGVTGNKTPASVKESVRYARDHAMGNTSHDEPLTWWFGIPPSDAVPKSRK